MVADRTLKYFQTHVIHDTVHDTTPRLVPKIQKVTETVTVTDTDCQICWIRLGRANAALAVARDSIANIIALYHTESTKIVRIRTGVQTQVNRLNALKLSDYSAPLQRLIDDRTLKP